MKISFSTLGCPGWSWEDMLVTAKDLGFNGIEIRGIENELYVPKANPFLPSNIGKTKDRLHKLSLEIPCLTSSCYLFEKSNIDFFIEEGKDYVDLANRLGTPYVRVLGDSDPAPERDIDFDFVASNLSTLSDYAEGKNVKVLIETNGFFADSNQMLKMMEKVKSPNLGVLWDIHHPFRFANEPVKETYSKLKNYIQFIHIKDSSIENGKVKYKMMGHGDIPVKEVLLLLKENQYSGYVSLEWVKRWCMDLEEPGVVFSHFANYIHDITQ
ncbi:MAG: sugar phosphate isomerase/epimerase [Clostridia bacterium]|nr:sugar phosphate isomerase/epimerase [Clostridia bacterium]